MNDADAYERWAGWITDPEPDEEPHCCEECQRLTYTPPLCRECSDQEGRRSAQAQRQE